jgi:hypothetical protein
MSGYIGTQPVPQATQTRDAFTCTAGQTSFATSGYTPGFLDVYLNGIKLAAADYTASNGSDVVLASGAALDDILEVVAYTSFEVVTDTVTNAGTVLNLDRTGSDGTILDLKKDGTTVGSIGAEGGKLYIDSSGGVEGKLKNQGSVSYLWHSNYLTSVNDNATDLGMSDLRYKDLYLSGGVYLGGVGSSNLLDDYEEGTWTPTVTAGSITYANAWYIKIGNLVTLGANVWNFSERSSSSGVEINVPFTSVTGPSAIGSMIGSYITSTTGYSSYIGGNQSRVSFYEAPSNTLYEIMKHNDLSSGSDIHFTIAYYTS